MYFSNSQNYRRKLKLKFKELFRIAIFLTGIFGLTIGYSQPYINPCASVTPIHIVILGSSTAAGAGPSVPDSTWVNRYRNYLQYINPLNQVTNLAIGGTTTYHIMPDWFVPPPGRPSTNPNNNISKAISLGADGVIINMPSNDAANNYGVNEQMFNFITMMQTADSVGLPVWVCTTQPKNFNQSLQQIQIEVRDSIISCFGIKAIDFWNGIADTNNNILPIYDSGDGTHLNDAAHGILFSRVVNKAIPNELADTLSITDHVIKIWIENQDICGDSNTVIKAAVVNGGMSAADTLDVTFEIFDQIGLSTSYGAVQLQQPLAGCTADTVSHIVNTYSASSLMIRAYLNSTDLVKDNDTSQVLYLYSQGHPEVFGINDTVCLGQPGILSTSTGAIGDTIVWYDAITGGNILGVGNTYTTPPLFADQSYFAVAVRGPQFFHHELFTTANTTTNWNGLMFDVVAMDSLFIDSLTLKIFSTGLQRVIMYHRNGSHVGFENVPGAWSLWDTLDVNVGMAGAIMMLDPDDVQLNPGDTLGVYLHMENAGSNLSYQAVGSTVSYSNNELEIISGSGIDFTFGALHTPRNYSGTVYYHFGFNPEGDCSSGRKEVKGVLSQETFNLGSDTTISISQNLSLTGPSGFTNYIWSNGATTNGIVVDTTGFVTGVNLIWLQATDPFGCVVTDSIIVTISTTIGLSHIHNSLLKIGPNPTTGKIYIDGLPSGISNIIVRNLLGEVVLETVLRNEEVDLSAIEKGVYLIELYTENSRFISRMLIL